MVVLVRDIREHGFSFNRNRDLKLLENFTDTWKRQRQQIPENEVEIV